MYMCSNNKETEKPVCLRADNVFVIIWLWDKDGIPLGGTRSFTSLEPEAFIVLSLLHTSTKFSSLHLEVMPI